MCSFCICFCKKDLRNNQFLTEDMMELNDFFRVKREVKKIEHTVRGLTRARFFKIHSKKKYKGVFFKLFHKNLKFD